MHQKEAGRRKRKLCFRKASIFFFHMYDVAFGNWHVLWGLNMPGDLWQPPLSLSLSNCSKSEPRYVFFCCFYQRGQRRKSYFLNLVTHWSNWLPMRNPMSIDIWVREGVSRALELTQWLSARGETASTFAFLLQCYNICPQNKTQGNCENADAVELTHKYYSVRLRCIKLGFCHTGNTDVFIACSLTEPLFFFFSFCSSVVSRQIKVKTFPHTHRL